MRRKDALRINNSRLFIIRQYEWQHEINWRINSVSSVDIHLRVYLKVTESTPSPSSHNCSVFVIIPRNHTLFAHPAFRLGPKFRNHQACRAWMGAGLPFQNTWDKHATMPLIRLAACFDGRITINDHILTNTLRALSPFPMF